MHGSGRFRRWRWLPIAIVAFFIYQAVVPLPEPTRKNCTEVRGKVADVYATKNDVVIKLKGDDGHYYMNHVENESVLADLLRKDWVDKPTTIYYQKHWSLINFNGKTRHIARMVVDTVVVYNEWQKN